MAKEILKEEILSEEELDKVAGGTIAETVKDTQLFHALGLIDRAYTASEVQNNPDAVAGKLNWALSHFTGNHSAYLVGVNANSANSYEFCYMEDNEPGTNYTREEFLSRVCDLAGKPNFDYTPYL